MPAMGVWELGNQICLVVQPTGKRAEAQANKDNKENKGHKDPRAQFDRKAAQSTHTRAHTDATNPQKTTILLEAYKYHSKV